MYIYTKEEDVIFIYTDMFSHRTHSGKHLIADIQNIRNIDLLHSIDRVKVILDTLCATYQYTIISKSEKLFDPHGFTLVYLLAESHISIHTFPERQYIAFDLYTCKLHESDQVYIDIYSRLLTLFHATGKYTLLQRGW